MTGAWGRVTKLLLIPHLEPRMFDLGTVRQAYRCSLILALNKTP